MRKSVLQKVIAISIAATMLLSAVFVIAAVPAAAVDGNWNTYGLASESGEGYTGEKKSVPGYEYTTDGFHMLSADWSTSTPFSQLSTKTKVNLKDGVYMQVRVDEFSYDAPDKWFNLFIWSTPHIDEGAPGFGTGVQTLIRPGTSNDPAVPGACGSVSWYTNEWTSSGSSAIAEENRTVENGKNVLTLVVTYDAGTGYMVTINGAEAPEKVIAYMNEAYAADSFAYIGFAMLSAKMGGVQSATVLKFGTSEANAIKPQGDDYKPNENYIIEYAPIANPDNIPTGQPCFIMNGDYANSALASQPKSQVGTKIKVLDNFNVKVTGQIALADAGYWKVDNTVSYDIADFPVVLCITKNLCSCGNDEGCYAFESANVYICTGDNVTPNPYCHVKNIDISYYAYDIDGDNYLYFFYDTSLDGEKFTGRINGTRFDFGIDINTPGANEFEIVLQAFFRTTDEAEAFAEDYFRSIDWEDDDDYSLGYNDGYDEGFDTGKECGYEDAQKPGTTSSRVEVDPDYGSEAYKRGYIEGFNDGFNKGYEIGYRQGLEEDDYDEGYTEGYLDGIEEAYEKGYNDGFGGQYGDKLDLLAPNDSATRYEEGYTDGYNEGFSYYYEQGYSDGQYAYEFYISGYEAGYIKGHQTGYDKGYGEGYDKGYADGNKNVTETVTPPAGNGDSKPESNNGDNQFENESGNKEIVIDLNGCKNSIGSPAVIILAALPTAFLIFKRKKH